MSLIFSTARGLMALFICILIFFPAWGQEKPKTFSLKDCIEIALQNNPDIRINKNVARISDNDYKGSFSNILPSISVSHASGRSRYGTAVTQDRVPILKTVYKDSTKTDSTRKVTGFKNEITNNDPYSRNNHSTNLNINQNIFDGGAWWNRIRQSKAKQIAASYDLDVKINQTITIVTENYINLLKQEKLLEVNEMALHRSQDELDKTQKMFEIGSVAKVDLYRAKGTRGTARIDVINQRNTVKQARQELSISLGYDPEYSIKIESNLKFQVSLLPLNELLQTAYNKQPALKRRQQEIKSQSSQVSIAKSAFLPQLSGSFSYGRNNSLFERIYQDFNKNWRVTISVSASLNLFNGFRDQVNWENARINLKNRRIDLENYKRQLASKIKVLYQTHQDLQEIIEINKDNLEAAQEEYRLATERFRLGAGTSLDVREAQVNLTRAERRLIDSQYNLIINNAKIQDAVGTIQEQGALQQQ